jgi:hypothetical protein
MNFVFQINEYVCTTTERFVIWRRSSTVSMSYVLYDKETRKVYDGFSSLECASKKADELERE